MTEIHELHEAPRMEPVSTPERIAALDVIRGFAILGVALAYTLWSLGTPPEESYSAVDRVLNFVLSGLVDMKMYTLLAFLFALGFFLQLKRAELRGVSIVSVYSRRLFGLALIGLAHALLLRNGDILVPYATMGLLLLLLRNASNRTLTFIGLVGLIYPILARAAWIASGIPFPQRPELHNSNYLVENLAWVRYWYTTAITLWPDSIPMFCFALYMGRCRFFEDLSSRRSQLRRALIAGLVIGVLGFVLTQLLAAHWETSYESLLTRLTLSFLWKAHAWGMATCYASLLMLLTLTAAGARWLSPLAAVGRMALTNYLMQASVMVPFCLIFGFFDKVSPIIGVEMAVALWIVQVPFSLWWLKHFKFGPAEWLWRSITYGQLQPIRIRYKPLKAVGWSCESAVCD